MTENQTTQQEVYEIRVQGHLDEFWSEWFEGLTLTHAQDGTSTLAGPVADQAALHGLLAKVRDLGLPLLSVNRSAPGGTKAGKGAGTLEARG